MYWHCESGVAYPNKKENKNETEFNGVMELTQISICLNCLEVEFVLCVVTRCYKLLYTNL